MKKNARRILKEKLTKIETKSLGMREAKGVSDNSGLLRPGLLVNCKSSGTLISC